MAEQMPTARISLPDPADMTADQRAVYDKIISGPRGRMVGPLRAALHNPELADNWQSLGRVLRYETSLPDRVNELAILVTARHWNSQLEWTIHALEAERAGLPKDIIDAIKVARRPDLDPSSDLLLAHDFTVDLLRDGDTDSALYDQVVATWGEKGVVELTAVIGYYTMVAMTLNAHRIPLPDDIPPTLPPRGKNGSNKEYSS